MDRQEHGMHSNRVKALEKERRKRKKFWWERKGEELQLDV